jgi:segregation and condensation protein A
VVCLVNDHVHPLEAENLHKENPEEKHNPETESTSDSPIKTHLLFHKALINDDDTDDDKLDQYMDIVEQLEHGMTIAFPNSFDRAIAMTFELAFEHHLDPWNIDLVTFSTEYLKHVRKDKNLDLVTAGRIILMAWKILKLQSDEVLSNAQYIQEQEQDYWHEPDGDWYLNDDDFEYTTEVINKDKPPLHEMIWRKGKRRVSLLELVGALEEAKREAEIIQILNVRHAEEREKFKRFRNQNISRKVHQESLQEDMELVYQRISKFNGHPIPLSEIYTIELDDKITTLVSSLFLAHNRKINIWQRKFPFGQIFVKNLNGNNGDSSDTVDEVLEVKEPKAVVKINVIEVDGTDGLRPLTTDEIKELQKDRDNGGDDKVLLREVDFDRLKKKKRKKSKPQMKDLTTSHTKIAS